MTLEWQADLIVVTLVAGAVGACISVVVGLPALRLRGLYLAVTTLAFAVAMGSYFLNPRFFDWLPDEADRVPRLPVLGRVDYTSTKAIYAVSAVAMVLAIVAVQGMRASRTGRVLLALRDNEAGTTAYGISVMRAKLTAFAIAGFLAGCSGGLFVHHQQAYQVADPSQGIGIFIAAVVGGLGSALGALLGSLFFWGTSWWLEGAWRLFASAIGVMAVLLIAPGGLAALAYQGRDWLLRQLAVRRGIHVPSMVADDQLAPLPVPAPTAPPSTAGADA
jgi:branched-chain amino acid transport system permease protein